MSVSGHAVKRILQIRHGPFDIRGGGGVLGYFGKKFPCSDFD